MIHPSPAVVSGLVRLYSDLAFGGVLRPTVHWRRMNCYGLCHEPSGKHPYGLIVLSTTLGRQVRWEEVLLHEMVHCYLDVMFPRDDEYALGVIPFHGPMFTAEANRVGALLGLPEVDEEHAWSWPMCVRWPFNPEPARHE